MAESMNANPINLCNLPPWAIASRIYNRNPQPIEIQGVQCAGKPLFSKLDTIAEPLQRGQIFHDYMDVRFQLHQWENQDSRSSRKALPDIVANQRIPAFIEDPAKFVVDEGEVEVPVEGKEAVAHALQGLLQLTGQGF
jgi:hypothetical protein